ncbi:MAG: hypothetical protein ACR2OZ_09925 [Verrucomicrobiales bacterium]
MSKAAEFVGFTGRLVFVGITTHQVGFDEMSDAFPAWLKMQSRVIKAIVRGP